MTPAPPAYPIPYIGRRGASASLPNVSVEAGCGCGCGGIRHLSSVNGFAQTPMWKVEGSSRKGGGAPGTCSFETSTTSLLW